ncbi:MAG: dihydropyrimidinase [Elusimicrobiota bacterium]|nr:dihydropyrimidinase [Elusimicrobiota bacterium]
MPYDLIVKGGTVVSASDTFIADIGVVGGKVVSVGKINEPAKRVVAARGKVVIPGGIDAHTHFDMPFMGATTIDDFTTGSTSAIFGGTTSIVDFAIQKKGETFRHALDDWHKRADGKSAVDYGFHMIVTDFPEKQQKEMDKLVDEGVSSFKLFMAYPGIFMSDDTTIFRALMRTRDNGGMICMHAENGSVIDVLIQKAVAEGKTSPEWHALTRPMTAEAEATHRAIALAEMAGVPIYFVHLSAGDAMEEVRAARARGLPVYAETCPQYLYLSEDDYRRPGFEGAKFVMSPPLRPQGNSERLWKGLVRNDLQVVSTDHCSFCMKAGTNQPGKELGKKDFSKIPNGAPGVEYRMLLLWDAVQKGKITENRFVEITSLNPAKIFGLHPRKGHLNPGADADIVVIDPNKPFTFSQKNHHSAADYNPYEGVTVKGSIRDVFSRGEAMVLDGKWSGSTRHGKFLKRTPRMIAW